MFPTISYIDSVGVIPMSQVKRMNDIIVDLRRLRMLCDHSAAVMLSADRTPERKSEDIDGTMRQAKMLCEVIIDELYWLKQERVKRESQQNLSL